MIWNRPSDLKNCRTRCFYVSREQIHGNRVEVSGGELHHLRNVLRLCKGDEITVLDGLGRIYEVILISCERDVAVGEIKSSWEVRPPLLEVTLFAGLPKADKMDMIVQKATELGAHGIVPILCRRTVPHLSAEQAQKRLDRWRQIAVEASKQSHRPFLPFVSHIVTLDEALEESQADLKLFFVAPVSSATRCQCCKASNRLKDVLKKNARAKKVDIFIGPEGGFTEDEVCSSLSAGAMQVSLGDSVLRTETAAIAALAIVLYELYSLSDMPEDISDEYFVIPESKDRA